MTYINGVAEHANGNSCDTNILGIAMQTKRSVINRKMIIYICPCNHEYTCIHRSTYRYVKNRLCATIETPKGRRHPNLLFPATTPLFLIPSHLPEKVEWYCCLQDWRPRTQRAKLFTTWEQLSVDKAASSHFRITSHSKSS